MRCAFVFAFAVALALLLVGCFSASCKPQDVHGAQMSCNGGARG